MRRLIGIALIVFLIPIYFYLNRGVWELQAQKRKTAEVGFVLPPQFSRILAFGNQGVLSDYLLLKSTTFLGGRMMYRQRLSEDDWRYIEDSLQAVTRLDPYFLDPYLLTEGTLAWDAGRIKEANAILKRGMKYRKNDWQLPFFIGFNYFYFLKDNKRGADYLMDAARRPDSPFFLQTLAARLDYYGGQTGIAIAFLKSLLDQTSDPHLRASLEKRLTALERAASIEAKVHKFEKERGRRPMSIRELVAKGYVHKLPKDPYGGKWIILKNGRVFSTSRFVPEEGGKGINSPKGSRAR